MGVLPDILAGNVIGVIAQRLIRRLCPHCKTQQLPTEDEALVLTHFVDNPTEIGIWKPVGCNQCEYQGYRGRFAIMELMKFSEDIDEMVSSRASVREIRDAAEEQGLYLGLAENAMEKVLAGDSSIDEVSRVVDLTRYIMAGKSTSEQQQ